METEMGAALYVIYGAGRTLKIWRSKLLHQYHTWKRDSQCKAVCRLKILLPSLIVFRTHLNQLEGSVDAFTCFLNIYAVKILLEPETCTIFCDMTFDKPWPWIVCQTVRLKTVNFQSLISLQDLTKVLYIFVVIHQSSDETEEEYSSPLHVIFLKM